MDISKVINADKLMEIAKNAGVDIDKAKALLAQYLPEAIDKATPEGKLLPPDKPARSATTPFSTLPTATPPPSGPFSPTPCFRRLIS
jgi:uncharacterized protein YidB (DUF937 family)